MPTYQTLPQFERQYGKLTAEQQKAFKAAVELFKDDLRSRQGFRRGLRIKRVQGTRDVWEMTWGSKWPRDLAVRA